MSLSIQNTHRHPWRYTRACVCVFFFVPRAIRVFSLLSLLLWIDDNSGITTAAGATARNEGGGGNDGVWTFLKVPCNSCRFSAPHPCVLKLLFVFCRHTEWSKLWLTYWTNHQLVVGWCIIQWWDGKNGTLLSVVGFCLCGEYYVKLRYLLLFHFFIFFQSCRHLLFPT